MKQKERGFWLRLPFERGGQNSFYFLISYEVFFLIPDDPSSPIGNLEWLVGFHPGYS